MAVFDSPDDIGGTEGGVTAEEHARPRGHEGRLVHDRHVPLAELESDVSLDPRKRIVLTDGEDDRVARQNLPADHFLLEA